MPVWIAKHEQGLQALAPACFEEAAGLLGRERGDLPLLRPGRFHGLADVARYQAVRDCLLERLVERDVDVLDGARREPAVESLSVESAHVGRGERLELQPTQRRLDTNEPLGVSSALRPLGVLL